MPELPQLSVVIPVYNEEASLPDLFARLYPALDALGLRYEVIFVNDGSRDRSAALLREQWERRPDVTRVVLFNANYGQHLAIVAGFEHCRGERVVTLDADLQNPARGDRQAAGGDGRRPRLRRRRAPPARGLVVPADRVEGDEPAARAHHAHPDDRSGLHAARLQPRDRRRDRREPRGQHVHPGARLHVREQSDRGRRRARRARRRQVEVLALQADPPQLRPHHRLLAGAAAAVLDVRDAGRGALARHLRRRHRLPAAFARLARATGARPRRCSGIATSSRSS